MASSFTFPLFALDSVAADKTDSTPRPADHAAHHNLLADAVNAAQAAAKPLVDIGDDGLPGVLGPTHVGWQVGTVQLASDTLLTYRIVPRRRHVITRASFEVTSASGTDDPFEIAVLNAARTAIVATTGECDSENTTASTAGGLNSTGQKDVALSVTLDPGVVYHVGFCATSTATVRAAEWAASGWVPRLIGPVANEPAITDRIATTRASSYPIPADTTSAVSTGAAPLVFLAE